jgi:hypothetical protein
MSRSRLGQGEAYLRLDTLRCRNRDCRVDPVRDAGARCGSSAVQPLERGYQPEAFQSNAVFGKGDFRRPPRIDSEHLAANQKPVDTVTGQGLRLGGNTRGPGNRARKICYGHEVLPPVCARKYWVLAFGQEIARFGLGGLNPQPTPWWQTNRLGLYLYSLRVLIVTLLAINHSSSLSRF